MKKVWKRMTALFLALVTLLGTVPVSASAADLQQDETVGNSIYKQIYVSPTGSSDGDGSTEATPVSLERARILAREAAGTMTGDIEVILAGGTYNLEETFKLTREDSGKNGYDIIYRAAEREKPVLSGGQTLEAGWTLHDKEKNIYRYNEKLEYSTRDLYVNGNRAWLARSHQQSELQPNVANFKKLKLIRTVGFQDTSANQDTIKYLQNLKSNGGIHQLEAVKNLSWRHFECPVDRIEGDMIYMNEVVFSNTASGNRRLHYDWGGTWSNDITYFMNAYGLLDTPGEFYLEKDGTLYYIPREGENLNEVAVIAPKLEELLIVEGRNEENVKEPQPGREVGGIEEKKIHNIAFDGIVFNYSTYLLPATEGYFCSQAGHTITGLYENGPFSDHAAAYQTPPHAAVQVNSGDGIKFHNCEFSKLGSTGLKITFGSRNCVVDHNYFTDTSGGGLYLGDTRWHSDTVQDPCTRTTAPSVGGPVIPTNAPLEEREKSFNNQVTYNYIYQTGKHYTDCVALWCGYEIKLNLTHNTIEDVPYTGINVGWGWRESGRMSHMRDNYIAYNRVVNFMTLMSDGGGLYMIQAQPGTIVEKNYFYGGRGNAIYLDAGLDYAIVRDNVMDELEGKWISANAEGNHRGMIAYDNYIPFGYTHNPYRITFQGQLSILGENYIYSDVFPEEAVEIMKNAGHDAPYEESPADDPWAGYVQRSMNIANGKSALQSSGASASYALDGDTSTASATEKEQNAWWQVDLLTNHQIDTVKLYSSTKAAEAADLKDFYVFVSREPFDGLSLEEILADSNISRIEVTEQAGRPSVLTFPSKTWGRYIRVQLKSVGRLSVAELEVPLTMPTDSIPYLKDQYAFNNENKKDTYEGQLVTRTINLDAPEDVVYEIYTGENSIEKVLFNGKQLPSDAFSVVDAEIRRNEWIDDAWIDSYLADVQETQSKWYEYTKLTLGKLKGSETDLAKGQKLVIHGSYAKDNLPAGEYVIDILFEKGMSRSVQLNVTSDDGTEIPEPNVVLHYNFDGNTDDSGGRSNGAALGNQSSSAVYADGLIGKAYRFTEDSKNYLTVVHDGEKHNLDVKTNQVLIDTYLYADAPMDHAQIIINRRNVGGSSGYSLSIYSAKSSKPSYLQFIVGKILVESKAPIPFGQWVHVTALRNDKVVQLYINGELQNEATIAASVNTNESMGLALGKYFQSAYDDYFTGYLDELLIQDSMKDTVAPAALGMLPAEEDIQGNHEVVLQLSEAATVDPDKVKVSLESSDVPVNVSAQTNTLHIEPATQWESNKTYTIVIQANALQDQAGNSNTAAFSYTFTTGTFEQQPLVKKEHQTVDQPKNVIFDLVLNGYQVSAVKNGDMSLQKDTDYTVQDSSVTVLKSYLEKTQLNDTVTLKIEFKKSESTVEIPVTITQKDVEEIKLIATYPQNFIGLSLKPTVQMVFNVPVKVIGMDKITMKETETGSTVEVDVSVNGTTLSIKPKESLQAAAQYTIEVQSKALENEMGTASAEMYTYSFTTYGGTGYIKEESKLLTYDPAAPADLIIETVLDSATIQSVSLPNRTLVDGMDYDVSDSTITLKQSFLNTLKRKTVVIVGFSNGESDTMVVDVRFREPVAEFDFSDRDNPLKDLTGNYNEASLNTASVILDDDQMGRVLKLSGAENATIQIPASETLSAFDDLYIDVWVKIADGEASGTVLSKKIMMGSGFALEIVAAQPSFVIRNASGNSVLKWPQKLTSGEDAQWHHIIAAFDSKTKVMSLQVDGEKTQNLSAPNVTKDTINAPTMSLNLGHSIQSGSTGSGPRGSFFNGEIAYLAVGNHAADILKPRFLHSSVADGAVGVSRELSMVLNFTADDLSAVVLPQISLTQASGSEIEVAATVSGNQLTVTPKEKLAEGTVYKLSIPETTLQDAAKNMLAVAVTITFTTEGTSQITSLEETYVTTYVGRYPELPEKVEATFSDGSTELVNVKWDNIREEQYQSVGTFQVHGTADGTSIQTVCHVTVLECHHSNQSWKSNPEQHWKECADCAFEILNTRETHSCELVGYKAPTYDEGGYSGDWVCSICDYVKEKGHIIPRLSGGGSISSYTITVTQTTGGKISPNTTSVRKGSDKTFTITAYEGYQISDVLVDGKSVGAVGTYTFKNVTARHTITAKFEKNEETGNVGNFIDVKSSDWFAEAVEYVVDEGLMNGTSETTFSPNGATTRGMIVTILYRQAGSPEVESDGKTWWSDARVWAMANSISDGTNMDKEITREQLATMLYRYAKFQGKDISKNTSLDTFKDGNQVSTYAVEALEWAAAEGIVTGKTGGVIDPQAGATRAETATMLMRFCELTK